MPSRGQTPNSINRMAALGNIGLSQGFWVKLITTLASHALAMTSNAVDSGPFSGVGTWKRPWAYLTREKPELRNAEVRGTVKQVREWSWSRAASNEALLARQISSSGLATAILRTHSTQVPSKPGCPRNTTGSM